MNDLRSRVSYLQGLAEGMNLNQSAEGRILGGVINVLNDFADTFSTIEENQAEIEEYLETVDEDLFNLEEDYYGDELLADDCECLCADEDAFTASEQGVRNRAMQGLDMGANQE